MEIIGFVSSTHGVEHRQMLADKLELVRNEHIEHKHARSERH